MAKIEGHENVCVAWDHYCRAQGGVSCGRNALIKLAMMTPDTLGLFGDPASPHPCGVETTSHEKYLDPHNAENQLTITVHWVAESKRYDWVITSRNDRPALEGDRFF
ncbi:hypothetical protein [Roseateles sp.]|uniref:hypothetical protein n=1 Tax=Roseateles sp. TaxID=1971397 RepID=UPI00286B5B3A|nr:hypothetical protein [Roseateles sp.]